jgi:ribosomal protein S18 acetylase RimI-like enzyme
MLNKNVENLKVIYNIKDVDSRIFQFFEENDNDFFPPISHRIELKDYIELIFDHLGILILFEDKGKIIGLTALCYKNPKYQYYLKYLAVAREYQGLGIGSILINAAANQIMKIGGSQLILTCWSSNVRARHVYNKAGFVIIDIIFNDRSHGEHTYIFALDLMNNIISNKILGMRIIFDPNSIIINKIKSDFINIDKENSVLDLIIQSTNCSLNPLKRLGVSDYFEEYSSSISHLINLTYTNLEASGFGNNLSFEYVNLTDYCIRYLESLTNSFLVVQDIFEEISNKISYSNFIYLNSDDQELVQEAIQTVKNKNNHKEYSLFFIELAKKYSCEGLILANNLFSGMYENNKVVDNIIVFDPLREFSIHIGSKRMKMKFS